MRAVRRSVCLAASLLMLTIPAAAPAQTPGDDQYTDPFGGEQDQGGGSQPNQGDQEPEETPTPTGPDTPTSSQDPAAAAPAPAATAAPAAEQLPRTGTGDAGLLALGGTLLLAGGVALRVCVSEPAPRRR